MTNIRVNFGYYVPQLSYLPDESHDGVDECWDMKTFCEWILSEKALKKERCALSVAIDQAFADLEWRYNDSKYDETNNLYYFRLKKLRSNNLPATTRLDSESKDIVLEDGQYLGEFNLIVFDPTNLIVAVQGNYFGLTLNQIQTALTTMRMRWMESTKQIFNQDNPGFVKFKIIPDELAMQQVNKKGIYRSIDIKGADVQKLARYGEKHSKFLSQIIRLASGIEGVTFNVQIGLGRQPKDATLSGPETQNLIDEIRRLNQNNGADKNESPVQMTVSGRDTVDDPLEKIDVLLPKLQSVCHIVDEHRSTLAAEVIYQSFIEQNYFNEEQHFQHRARMIAAHR
jgi:hypothetical protein